MYVWNNIVHVGQRIIHHAKVKFGTFRILNALPDMSLTCHLDTLEPGTTHKCIRLHYTACAMLSTFPITFAVEVTVAPHGESRIALDLR